jgi:SAM-dependent methyltransferase
MSGKAIAYRCPIPACGLASLRETPAGLSCPNGHEFAYIAATRIPVFAKLAEDANEYAHGESAEKHDNALRWVLSTFQTDEASLRDALVARLELRRGDRVLITGAGAGNDLPFLARHLAGSGEIYAQDIAQQMLVTAVERHGQAIAQSGVDAYFSVSDATHLPFADGFFDAAYHFGGINLFSDIRRGIAEMNRVVKDGGRVVIGDEGLAPWLKDTEIGRMLVKNNALYGFDPPLGLLPETVRAPKLSWELCNTFYVIEFSASRQPLPIAIDVAHVGTRGGTIRTRYLGQLEGVDPQLRDRVYEEAARRGMSRVEYMESLFRSALAQPERRDER